MERMAPSLTARARLAFDLATVTGATALASLPALPMFANRWPHATSGEPRVAIVSDTIDDVNGVAIGLRRLGGAARAARLPITLGGAAQHAHLGTVTVDDDGVARVPTILARRLAFYPEMQWAAPQVAALAHWLADEQIDLVQCATPGPLGFAALAAARLLGLPCIGQFHTEVGEFAARMSGDARIGAATTRMAGWFYRRVDRCLAPSLATRARLIDLGLEPSRIELVPRGTDLSLFHPRHRDRAWLARFGLGDGPVILYVGRLSHEKNLAMLGAAFAEVRAQRPHASLLLVGDGPAAATLDAPGVVRAGYLYGEDLARAYASADLFAMPSETETFGNVVVEAQAAGLPVVVAGGGAAREQMLPGETGLVVDGARPDRMAAALVRLIDDRLWRADMGQRAHRWAQRYDLAAAARATYAIHQRSVVRAAEAA